MIGFSLDFREGVAFEVQVTDYGFMAQAGPISCFCPRVMINQTLASEKSDIAFDGSWACGQQHGEVFVAQESSLVVGLSCEACQTVTSEFCKTVIGEVFEVGVKVNKLESDCDLFSESNMLSCWLFCSNGFIGNFTFGEGDVSMFLKVE